MEKQERDLKFYISFSYIVEKRALLDEPRAHGG